MEGEFGAGAGGRRISIGVQVEGTGTRIAFFLAEQLNPIKNEVYSF